MSKMLKIVVVAGLVLAVAAIVAVKQQGKGGDAAQSVTTPAVAATAVASGVPRLVDLGSVTCIPCKMMAPILEELKKEYAGRLSVEFYRRGPESAHGPEVQHEAHARRRSSSTPPAKSGSATRDSSPRTTFWPSGRNWAWTCRDPARRHRPSSGSTPAKPDERPKESICYMCDGDINAKTLVTVQTDKGPVRLCGPHCYFIMYSCLTEDKANFEKKVTVTDWAAGKPIPLSRSRLSVW